MSGIGTRIHHAAATHRQAAALAVAAAAALDRPRPTAEERNIRALAERLRVAAALLAPGWLGAPLAAVPAGTPLGDIARPELVRIGTGYPLGDASFPVVVPLGHLALNADARDIRVAGALRAVLLRLLATIPAGSLRVRVVDPAGVVIPPGYGPYAPLHPGVLAPPAVDKIGLREVLTEAEHRVYDGEDRPPDGPGTVLLLIATWPEETQPVDLARVAALAGDGPAAGLHLLVGGWPPPMLEADSTSPQLLPNATQVTLHNPHVVVGHPPGESYAAPGPPGQPPVTGLSAPVFLDETPPVDMVARVCREVAGGTAFGGTVAGGTGAEAS